MPIRIRKSVKVAPGTRINVSNKGVSTSVGAGPVRVTTTKKGKGCLYSLFILPFEIFFQVCGLLFRGIVGLFKRATVTQQGKQISFVAALALIVFCVFNTAVAVIAGPKQTSTPKATTQSISIVESTATTPADTPTLEPLATDTPIPTNAPADTPTIAPTSTTVIVVSQPTLAHPPGTSGQCVDSSYTSALHKQGACSRHKGVLVWWGP